MFWKKKARSTGAIDRVTDAAAVKIVMVIARVQHAFAKTMNRRTKNISARTWKWLIIVFAIAWGSMSIHLMVNAFKKQPILDNKRSKGQYNIHFMVKPALSDSLVLMEEIYQQLNKKSKK